MLTRIAGNVGAQVTAQALAFAERFLLVGLLIRVWGSDTYADWVVLLAAAGLLTMGELGLGIYFGNSWQHAQSTGDQARFARLFRISLAIYAVVAAVLGLGVAAFLLVVDPSQTLPVKSLSEADTVLVLLMLCGTQIGMVVRGSVTQVYRGRGQFARGTLMAALPLAACIAAAALAALLGAGPVQLAALYLFFNLAGTGLVLFDIHRRFPDLPFVPAWPNRAEISRIAQFTKWNMVLMGAPVALLHIPILQLGAAGVAGAMLVGFVLVRTLGNYIRSLTTLISLSVTVEMMPEAHRGEWERVSRRAESAGRAISGLAGALGAGMLFLGQDFVGLWSGERKLFDPSTTWAIVAAVLIAAAAGPLFTLFMLANKPKPAALASLAQLAVALALCAILAPVLGGFGVAIGLVVGELAAWCIMLPLARRHFGLHPWRYLMRCALTMLATGAWCALVLAAAVGAFGSQRPPQFLACAAIFGLLGVIPAIFVSLPQTQRLAAWRLTAGSGRQLLARVMS